MTFVLHIVFSHRKRYQYISPAAKTIACYDVNIGHYTDYGCIQRSTLSGKISHYVVPGITIWIQCDMLCMYNVSIWNQHTSLLSFLFCFQNRAITKLYIFKVWYYFWKPHSSNLTTVAKIQAALDIPFRLSYLYAWCLADFKRSTAWDSDNFVNSWWEMTILCDVCIYHKLQSEYKK